MGAKRRLIRQKVGWREYVALPALGIHAIKAKIDTGARTSALHASGVEIFVRRGREAVRFAVKSDDADSLWHTATLLEQRQVRSSNGAVELRPVIRTVLQIGARRWPIELTLTDRADMQFELLLGREAIRRRTMVIPGRSFLVDRQQKEEAAALEAADADADAAGAADE